MPRRALVVLSLISSVILAGCNVIGALTGAPTTEQVTVQAPAGILVGDSAQVRASATKSNGVTIPDLTPDAWRSSDPSVISINTRGVMKGLIAGRQATIFADFGGKTGSAIVTVGSDDSRLAYALADQPTAASPYSPDASTRFSSSGGTITVTRTSVGQYTVRFAGLGRPPGGHDNVQVTGYGGVPVYCKPALWDASSADLVVQVNCVLRDATKADSKFTILAIGARPFGASTPLGFLLSNGDTGTVILDSAGTARNSAGGTIAVGHNSEGNYSTAMAGLGPQFGGVAGPVGLIVSGSGQGARRCHVDAYDLTTSGTAIGCNTAGGGPGDSPFSLLWFSRGRPGLRYGYAWANNMGNTLGYSPPPDASANSSGGAITSKRTGAGTYQIVFAGLAHAPGATEGVQVSAFGSPGYCTLASWGNSGANDLVANVTCWDTFAAPANFQFNILIVQ
jgi:hypothetical protein